MFWFEREVVVVCREEPTLQTNLVLLLGELHFPVGRGVGHMSDRVDARLSASMRGLRALRVVGSGLLQLRHVIADPFSFETNLRTKRSTLQHTKETTKNRRELDKLTP